MQKNKDELDYPYFYSVFATKDELRITDRKVEEIAVKGAAMAASLEKLTDSVLEISKDIKKMILDKGVNDGIKKIVVKCICITTGFIASIIIPLITAHSLGYTRIIGKWLNG